MDPMEENNHNNKEQEEEEEQVSDHFTCAVCLDLLYKPVVLVCGHLTCFWCCHRSMDMRGQSHCPLCRHPYRYFPAICRMLDIFLKKMYPVSYARRKRQTLEDEEQSTLDCLVSDEEVDQPVVAEQSSDINSGDSISINPSSTIESKSKDGSSAENCKRITVADVLCAACKQLLFRPVALNCGHVYCEACITIPEDGVIKCQVCECRHPSGFPKVCKELENVLQEQFSSDYALRSSTLLSQEQIQSGNPLTAGSDEGSKFPTGETFLQWWAVHGSTFHPGVGCDICGMCPIIGERYQCKDCEEKLGYDLCGDCHGAGSNLPGRFNQKHTPKHRLELIKPVINRDVIYRLLSGQLAVVSAASRSQSNPVTGRSESASTSLEDDNGDNDEDEDGDEDDGGVESAVDSRIQNQN
uniref:E3 ubiquitin-protein ligase PRT1-like isoform X1 n=1 Tax=Tanacetum cinerariifolium TaxID=118510 RepID=A0A6L2KWE4_TANCI|nr:E3 ubiquitin-protein ligase PRT1-like isoform X1 [Tanacetum cinerariifolium]